MNNLENDSKEIISRKSMTELAKFIENTPKSPDITFKSIWLILANFGTHIIWSTDHCHSMLIGVLKHS